MYVAYAPSSPPPPTPNKWTVDWTCAQNCVNNTHFLLNITCIETSKKVQPISPDMAKQYLEEYHHNFGLWLAQRTQNHRHHGKKKRAISFNQADLQHSKWDQGSDHSSSAEHGPQGLRGPHRRLSVDVRLLQMKHNSTALEKEPSCAEETKVTPPSCEITVTT